MNNKQEKIIKLSDEILTYLLEFKEKHPDFTFSLRKRDSVQSKDKRLINGQWFQGSHYIYVPLFKKGDSARKIKTVGFVISIQENGNMNNYIEISFKSGIDDPQEKEFHKQLANHINLQLHEKNHGIKAFNDQNDIWNNLEEYITNFRNYALELLDNLELKTRYLITENDFQKDLNRIKLIKAKLLLPVDSEKRIKQEKEFEDNNEMLNQILYGPPGTGKTYHSVNKAIAIIEPDFDFSQSRKVIKDKFYELVNAKQIIFTTFHQSMSYEDFIEGIKPIKPKSDNSSINYKIEDGIFKQIVKNAMADYLDLEIENNSEDSFDQLYDDFIASILPFKGIRQATFRTKTGVEMMLVDANESSVQVKYLWSSKKKDSEGQHIFSVTKEKLKRASSAGIIPSTDTNLVKDLHPIVGHIHCELFGVYKSFFDFITENKVEPETIYYNADDLTYEDIKEQFDLLNKETINATQANNYVLIIDEINRGNVSQIFGELITLIEDDKRLGKGESLEVMLPYSKENFGVPPNLYIVGTMNTADRSIEALDTALRRRFSFTEMMPQSELLSPSALYCQLLWQYETVGWDHPEFLEKENQLFNFLKVSDELIAQRKEIWENMKTDYIRDDYSYFDDFDYNGFNLQIILETINRRIEVLLNRDHLIGHSYFLKVRTEEQLKITFKNNIIPLLQEYFYGDYEKIGLILGSEFFEQSVKYSKNLFASFDAQNYTDNGIILRMKTIDEDFDIIAAINTLLNIKV